ncbi:MAG: hypothetical protein R6V83_01755 [Candidatus Thorarchaeota archaeon]
MRRIALAVVIVSILILIPTNLNSTPFRPTESPLLGSSPGALAEESGLYSGSGQSLEYSIGGITDTAPTTFSVSNASTFVNWTSEIDILDNETQIGDVEIYYPRLEWRPTKVIDSLGNVRNQGTEWDYSLGTLTIYNSSVDVHGVWTIKFIGTNYIENLQLGVSGQSLSDSAVLNVGDDLKLRSTTPWIENARVGFELTDPYGTVWNSTYNTTGTPSTAWHVPSFENRLPLTVSASNVDSDLNDFPLLVNITDTDLKNQNKVQSDGDDIVFVQNGEVLPHELTEFTQSLGELTAWVKTNLSSSAPSTVYMYYGNPAVGPCENTTDVWTNGYEAAWHLDETYPDEADGNIHEDSTSGDYDGVQHGNYYELGIVQYAQEFDGTDDWISVNATEGLEPEGDVTISGWFYLNSAFDSSSTATQVIMSKYLDADRDMVVALAGTDYGSVPAGTLVWKVESSADSPTYTYTNATYWSPGWYHYSVTLDADSMVNNDIYIDSVNRTDSHSGSNIGSLSFSADWGIGGGSYETGSGESTGFLNGSIDEVRVSTGIRSQAWISAEYDSQNSPDTFVQKGTHTQRTSPEHTFIKTIDSTAPAGEWTASTYYNDTGTSVTNKTGLYERNFIVKHDTSLKLKSPGDAVGDQLSNKIAGDMLYVVLDLQDDDNISDYVEGATVAMNWTVDGTATQKTLVDHGNGTYSRTLNTTDLATEGRWRINIDSYHPYYNNASYYFDIDLSHETEILYETPPSTPVGDDFTVRITVRDAYNGNPITGASIASNGSLIDTTDNGDGTYDLVLNSEGLTTGNYVYHINATPTETYLLKSTVDIVFTLRDIHTATYGVGGNSVSTPYEIDTSFTITYNDTDHSYDGISGANWFVNEPSGVTVGVSNNTDGSYDLAIDVGTTAVGTYNIEVTFSKTNYENSTFLLELTITEHDTFIVVDLDQEIPWGENSTFSVTWYDSDTGDTDISESVPVSDITVNGTSYGQNLGFDLDSDDWAVGTYHLNVTVYSDSDNYEDAWTNVTLEVRAHNTYIDVNHDQEIPWGENSTFAVTWYDSDTGGTNISGTVNVSDVTVNGSSYGQDLGFDFDSDDLTVDSYQLNVTVYSDSGDYVGAWTTVTLKIRPHHTYVEVNYDEEVPWGENSTFVVTWYDSDTGGSEIDVTNLDNVTVGSDYNETFSFEYDTSSLTVGSYQRDVDVHSSSVNYEDAHTIVNITIRAHHTYINVNHDQKVPWGANSTFLVTWFDSDTGGTNISDSVNITDMTVNGSSYGTDLGFSFDSDDLTVDSYQLNVTLYSGNGDYESAWTTVTLEIRAHHTTVTVDSSPVTPWGYDSDVSIVFWDVDTNSSVPITNVTPDGIQFNYETYGSEQFSTYSPTLTTSSWTVDTYSVTLSVSCVDSNRYYESASNNFTITIRAHQTTVTAVVDDATPWGFSTPATVTFWDTDNNEQVPIGNVSSIDFNPTGYDSQSESSYTPTLTTDAWDVGLVPTAITVQCVSSNLYYTSASSSFNITIRTHHTTLTAVATETTPWGYDTDIVVTFWDTDTDSEVPIDNVTSIQYSSSYGTQTPTKSYTPTLNTSNWDVGTETVTVEIDCADSNTYYEYQSSTFDITIRTHHTYIEVNYDEEVPWGENSTFVVTWYDSDTGGSEIDVTNLDNVTVGSDYNETFSFEYDTSSLTVGSYQRDVDVYSSSVNYEDAHTIVNITIRAHHTYINVNHDQNIPWGVDSFFNVTWYDSDTSGTDISSSVSPSDITVDGVSYGSSMTFNFDSSSWTVGTYYLNVTLFSSDSKYDDAWTTITLEIRAHHTSVTVDSSPVTPWGYDTNIEVVFWDEDTNSSVPSTNVTTDGIQFDYESYGSELFNTYSPTLSTSSWTVGTYSANLSVSCVGDNQYYDSASKNFEITIRAHHTTLSAVVDDATPWGFNTSVTVTFWDTDNNEQVPIQNVSSIDFNPTEYGSQSESSYTPTLTTDTWDVGVVSTSITVQCEGSNLYYNSASSSFDITIRTHHTTLTAVATEISPWGYDTDVAVTFWDTDTNSEVPIANVTSISYTSSYETQNHDGTYTPTLSTSSWDVGTETVTIEIECADTNTHYEAQSSTFDIIIRAHQTYIEVNYDEEVPWGENSTFVVTWYDSDTGGSEIDVTNLDNVTVGSDYNETFSFEYDTSSLEVGSYQRDVDVYSSSVKYENAHTVVNITIRAHHTYIDVNHDQEIPWGDTSSFTVTWYDSDTGGTTIDVSNLDQITVGVDSFSSFSFDYNTSSLGVGSYERDVDLFSNSSNYYGASTRVSISVRAHHTSPTVNYDSQLPWGYQSSFKVSWHDLDTGNSEINVTNLDNITVGIQSFDNLSFTYDTSNWELGEHQKSLNLYSSDAKYRDTSIIVNFTIIPHRTSIVVNADTNVPWGENSTFSLSWYDTDAGDSAITNNLDNVTVGSQSFENKSFDFMTDNWSVGTYRLDVHLYSSNSSYMHARTQVNVTIRPHHTSVSVTGGLTVPYGNKTPVTVVFWDNDWNEQVPIDNVSSNGVAFEYEESLGNQEFGNYSMRLNTTGWDVGSHSINLTITCVDSNQYYKGATHTFSVTIRRLGIRVTHEPTDLIIPSGDDFNIVLRVNVSEVGNQYDGYPISGLNNTEVRVENSTHTFSITWSDLTNGRYNLTLNSSELTDESYRIRITIKKSFGNYSSDYIVVEFRYRDARSYLSSPSYPQVTTPYDTDVEVRLNYTDVDRNKGIDNATITSEGITIYNEQNLGNGEYIVTLDVSGLSKGDHPFNLTAGASQYENKTLTFTLTIRIAYTYAIPTVGALDIPVGNDPVFYVDYWDTDHDEPVVNASLETTWNHDVNVTYLPGEERYKVIFSTEDTTPLQQNTVVTFNFSKGENYQFGIFNLTITVRTHNTDFRLVSSIDPRSLEGVFDISVYYGDLDNNVGINSTKVDFRVEEETLGSLNSSWDYDADPGFYTIYVNASQFTSLGIKTFIVYANWTGSVYTYKNRTFTTTANVVGQESSLTLLESAEPIPYLENMSYLLFFSDLNSGEGIDNETGAVHIYVEFQGYQVNTSNVDIWEVDRTNQPGNYSIRFNTTIFSTTGRIYMNLNVNWSKGVEPLYTNRTDTISLRILPRDTLISLTPPSPTSYGENGRFTFTFEDVTGAEAQDILDDDKLTISLNISFSYSHSAGTFTIEFNTTSFGELGTKSLQLNVTWAGSPFYANRTNRIVFIDVIARQTVLDYLAPAPTQYLDNVTFSVTWTDVTGTSSDGIENANVSIYNGSTAIDQEYYSVTVIGNGQYEIEFNTTYYDEPAEYELNVTIYSPEFYYFNSTGIRQFTVRQRVTLLSSEPIRKVPYNSSITVILNYQDLYTLDNIGNDSSLVTLEIRNGSDWFFTSEWKPDFGYYVVEIQTYNHPELNISDPTSLELNMSYEHTTPYYGPDTLFIEFELRIRSSSLSIDDTPETTPYNDNASLTVFYEDTDAEQGIEDGDIHVYNGSQPLNESAHYTLSSGSIGFYEISLNTSALGAPGQYTVNVYANWTLGSPYHDNATVSVRVRVRERDTNVEITVPPAQTRFLDNVTFSFVYTDLDADEPIVGITVDDVKIYLQDGTELTSGFSLVQDGESFEISIPSDLITDTLVSNYELNVTVDWDESQIPYYSDDQTIVKVSITNRIMSISLVPISTTPLRDNMTVEFTLADDDTANPITGAIVEFDCKDPSLSGYTLTEGTGSAEGTYSISFNTTQLNKTGTYSFDLVIKWNSTQQPYYANLSTITLRGSVDRIYTSLQNDPPNPSSVQYTDSVSVVVYFEDLDHNQTGIAGATMYVHYLEESIVPSNLVVDYIGSGAYNISFDTSNLEGTGSQTLNITAEIWPYTSRTVTPSFTVTVISTTLVPSQETIEIFWKEYANVSVDYNNLLDGNLIPGATVTYSWDGGSDVLEDPQGDGIYNGSIDTELAATGTRVVTINATKNQFATSVTTVTLVVKTLPSEIISITPAELVKDIDRGSQVNITLYLNDTNYVSAINDSYVDEIYATFQGTDYALTFNGTGGYYNTTIPDSATILPIDFYTVRLTAKLSNYDPASYQFKVNLLQTRTDLSLTGETNEDMVAVYSEIVNFTVLLTAPDLGITFSDATVSWYLADTGQSGNFTNAGDGVYWVAFNTTEDAPGFGIWGLSFKARPYANASEFAGSTASLSLTVKKITTQADRPPSLEVYWGWKGNVSFTYVDLSFNDTIAQADAPYALSEIRGTATAVGDGEYLVPVDTSLLVPDTYQLSLTFTKENYQEATAVIRIAVLEVPTEIVPEAPEKNCVENESTDLVVPVGESVDITFFYNDTDDSDGYVGGLENAVNITGISHTNLLETIRFDLEELGDGYYRYSFDTTSSALYQEGGPRSSPNPYTLLVKLELANRTTATIRISVTIIDIPTELSIIQVDRNLLYGDRGRIVIYYNDTWHNQPVTGANLSITGESELKLLSIEDSYPDEDRPGYYIVEYVAASPLLQADSGISTLVLLIEMENTEAQVIEQDVTVNPTQAAETLNTAFTFGTPISIVIILLLLAYIKIWSVPKRLRQINGQIKSLEKGKLPSPVEEAKSRQHLVAELYNDTYKEVELTKAPEEMPPEAIEVEVPELGELLMMLSILTKLTPEELEDFKGDIDKMRPSEKAAFIKEVIHQEAIRAAKREGKETDVIIEEVREDARKRLRGEDVPEEPEGAPEVREVEDVERILLEEEEEERLDEVTPAEPGTEAPPDRLSPYELEELRKDLQKRGVPPHEIDTIMKQAERLPRDLVDELLDSLDENGV